MQKIIHAYTDKSKAGLAVLAEVGLRNMTGDEEGHYIKSTKRPGAVAHTYNPSTLGGRGRWITRSRDRDHPGQQGETPSLLKIEKLAGHGGACL